MNLIIDVGNTKVKFGIYQKGKLLHKLSFKHENFQDELDVILQNHKIQKTIISSTGKLSKSAVKHLKKHLSYVEVSSELKLPFKNKYKTPKTLGADRIAVMAAATHNFPQTNILVIDAGTCITYDMMTAKGVYEGGAISPGLYVRYQSLHHLTANLPFLDKEPIDYLAGKSTNESIHSGILNGLLFEIDGVINEYKTLTPNLTVILTGGDANFLANRLKNTIFATSNFLIDGLNYLLEYNVNE